MNNKLDSLRAMLCAVGVVGKIDGHQVVRRESVLELVDRAREHGASHQAQGEVVAWVRVRADGTLSGDWLWDGNIEQVRKDSGGWKPLTFVAPSQAAPVAQGLEDLAHEIVAASQIAPGEGIEDAAARIRVLLAQAAPRADHSGDPELVLEATDEMIDAACAAVPDLYRVDAIRAIEAALLAAPSASAQKAEPFGTFVERDDGTTEFRRAGEPHTPTAMGGRAWTLYAAPAPSASPAARVDGDDPMPDQLRAIARDARNTVGPSDEPGREAYVLAGWRAARATATTSPAVLTDEQIDAAHERAAEALAKQHGIHEQDVPRDTGKNRVWRRTFARALLAASPAKENNNG
ncbi:hypothetical protein [Cupriavidus sp. TMH.W2]|uniref:hypothetical protein n=1 Tax=Cupriavidus sp. TMH.W2 TaxID=3434465 RepID=UPI003D7876F5